MKLEVGMYVRTKSGDIFKINKIEIDEDNCYIFDDYYFYEQEQIIKVSSNIIEVGDYVNGYEVTSKDQFLGFGNHDWYMLDNEIKSIVTKEQFESMSYKVN